MTVPHRITVDEAVALIAASMPAWPAMRVPLPAALGAILREPIVAERDQPPFDRVTMDGIAIRHADWAAGVRRFAVTGVQGAGAAARALAQSHACVEVMTGSVLPAGADCVIPVERLRRDGQAVEVETGYVAAAGQSVHRRGSDHRRGAVLLEPGVALGAPEQAILTLSGRADVAVGQAPRVALVSTGDELVEPGAPIADYQIRASNDRAIDGALRRGGLGAAERALLPDDPGVLEREIGRLLAAHDVLILTGGVSMGQFDHVPRTLAALGVASVFHKVTQRPGLPLWFGRTTTAKVVFALPGNPVSSLVCAVRYVLPALAGALGARPKPAQFVRLAADVRFEPDLTLFLPVQLHWPASGEVTAVPRPTNTSGDFVALGGTDGFVELPRGQSLYPAGFVARFFSW